MNRTELVKSVSNETGIHEKDVRLMMDFMIDEIVNAIITEGKVTLRGLGTFEMKTMKARNYAHPQTGEKIKVPNRESVRFKMSTVLKKRLDR
jgi:nucleoid DNA-binding protein